MDFKEIDIASLLPQGESFLFVDKLIFADTGNCTTEFEVTPDHLFVQEDHLMESGIIENMAQTCAAQVGYINSYLLHGEVKKGFIGSIRNLKVFRNPMVNETLNTTLIVKADVMGVKLVDIRVTTEQGDVAECEMKISLYEG